MDLKEETAEPSDDLGPATMTLAEVADTLGVHYMTVYRYVRIGKLPAWRQGRTWRVDPADVEILRAPPDDGKAGPPRWDLRFQSRLAAFDDLGAWQVIEAALAGGRTPIAVYTDIVIPALRQIGDDWAAGRIGVAQERAASTICWRLVGRLGLQVSRPGVGRGSVVLALAPGDAHHLPCALAADYFRSAGFDVVDCGAAVPLAALLDLIDGVDSLVAVGISCTLTGNDGEILRTVAAVKDHLPDTVVIAGGAGAVGLPPGELFGADIVAGTAVDGLAELDQLLSPSSRSAPS